MIGHILWLSRLPLPRLRRGHSACSIKIQSQRRSAIVTKTLPRRTRRTVALRTRAAATAADLSNRSLAQTSDQGSISGQQ